MESQKIIKRRQANASQEHDMARLRELVDESRRIQRSGLKRDDRRREIRLEMQEIRDRLTRERTAAHQQAIHAGFMIR